MRKIALMFLLLLSVGCGNGPQQSPASATANSPGGDGAASHWTTLSWNASSSTGVVGYNLYRATQSGGPYTRLGSAPLTGTSYQDTDVTAGTTYYYVVTAVDGRGAESMYSNQASGTVPQK